MLTTLDLPQKIRIKGTGLEHRASVIARSFFPANSLIYEVSDFISFLSPTYQTVQISKSTHVLDTVLSHLNHSCSPNTFVDCKNLALVASRDIEEDEELNFFYPSTEWKMSSDFSCSCGSQSCIHNVSGAYSLSEDILRHHKLNEHIRSLLSLSPTGSRISE